MAYEYDASIQLAPSSDTGTSGDNITQDQTPLLKGSISTSHLIQPSLSSITIYQGFQAIRTVELQWMPRYQYTPFMTQVGFEAQWQVQVEQPLSKGDYKFSAGIPGGFLDQTAQILASTTITIDPVTLGLNEASNSGSKSDGLTNDTTPTLEGFADPGQTVTLFLSDQPIPTEESIIAGSDGKWTYTLTEAQALQHGQSYNLIAQIEGPGNSIVSSAPLNITIDTELPQPSTLTLKTNSGNPDDNITNQITLSGVAPTSDVGRIFMDGKFLATYGGEAGEWERLINLTEVPDGEHTFKVEVEDAAGNIGKSELKVMLDRSVSMLTGGLATDSDTGEKNDDGLTKNQTPTLEGTVEVGSTVTILAVGTSNTLVPVGNALVDDNGHWTFTFDEEHPLTDDKYSFRVQATDVAGNEKLLETPISFTVDTQAPDASTIALDPASNSGDKTDTITNEIKLTGKANYAGEIVSIFMNGDFLTTVEGGEGGEWSFSVDSKIFPDGKYSFTAEVEDAAGNIAESTPLNVTLDTKVGKPMLELSDFSDSGEPGDSLTNVSLPILQGQAEPGSQVDVFLGGTFFATVQADNEIGRWSLDLEKLGFTQQVQNLLLPLEDGKHLFTAKATDVAGNVSDVSETLTLTIDTKTDAPTIALHADSNSGSKYDTLTKSTLPTLTGTAEAGSEVFLYQVGGLNQEVKFFSNLAVPGQIVGKAIADEKGEWSITLREPLAQGEHSFIAKAIDKAGNDNYSTEAFKITIDTEPPQVPTLLLDPETNSGNTTDTITRLLPKLTGSAEFGSTVEIFMDGELVDTAVADAQSGVWEFTLPTMPSDGAHVFAASVTDAAGNSAMSQETKITIDTKVNAPTVILSDLSDTGSKGDLKTNLSRPTLTGTAEAGSEVQIFSSQQLVGSGQADDNGNWSIETTLSGGEQTLKATITDVAGNTASFDALTLTVDQSQPTATIVGIQPKIRDSSVDSITVQFSEAVYGFDASSILLQRDGNPVSLDQHGVQLTTSDQITWTLSGLTDLTETSGRYTLAIDGFAGVDSILDHQGITDEAGNMFADSNQIAWLTGYTGKAQGILLEEGAPGISKAGDSTSEILEGTENDDVIFGGRGNDTIRGGEQSSGTDILVGDSGDDRLITNGGTDLLRGGAGNDELRGGGNHDQLRGNAGIDTLVGGAGNDFLIGGFDSDILTGGAGRDTFVAHSLGTKPDTITDFDVSQDLLDLSRILKAPTFGQENDFAKYHQFVRLRQTEGGLAVRVDTDGIGSGKQFTTVAILEGDLTTLNSTNIIVSRGV